MLLQKSNGQYGIASPDSLPTITPTPSAILGPRIQLGRIPNFGPAGLPIPQASGGYVLELSAVALAGCR